MANGTAVITTTSPSTVTTGSGGTSGNIAVYYTATSDWAYGTRANVQLYATFGPWILCDYREQSIGTSGSWNCPFGSVLGTSGYPKNILNLSGVGVSMIMYNYAYQFTASTNYTIPYTPRVDESLILTYVRSKVFDTEYAIRTFNTIALRDTYTNNPANLTVLMSSGDHYCRIRTGSDTFNYYLWNKETRSWDAINEETIPTVNGYIISISNADIYDSTIINSINGTTTVSSSNTISWGDGDITSNIDNPHVYDEDGTYNATVIIRKVYTYTKQYSNVQSSLVCEVKGSVSIVVNSEDPDPDPPVPPIPEPDPDDPDPDPDPPDPNILEVYTRVTKVGKKVTLQLDNNKNLEFTNVTWTINTG